MDILFDVDLDLAMYDSTPDIDNKKVLYRDIGKKLIDVFLSSTYFGNINHVNYLDLLIELDNIINNFLTNNPLMITTDMVRRLNANNMLIISNINDYNFDNVIFFYEQVNRYMRTHRGILPTITFRANSIHRMPNDINNDINMEKHIDEYLIRLGNLHVRQYDISNIGTLRIQTGFIDELLNYHPFDDKYNENVIDIIKRSSLIKNMFRSYISNTSYNSTIDVRIINHVTTSDNSTIFNTSILNLTTTNLLNTYFKSFIKSLFFNTLYFDINTTLISTIANGPLSIDENNNLKILGVFIIESYIDFILTDKFFITITENRYTSFINMLMKTLTGRIFDTILHAKEESTRIGVSLSAYTTRHARLDHLAVTNNNRTITHLYMISNLIQIYKLIYMLTNEIKYFGLEPKILGHVKNTDIKNKYLKYKIKYLHLLNKII